MSKKEVRNEKTDKFYEENIKPFMVLIEGWTREGLTIDDICKNIKIGKTTMFKYKKLYEELDEALKKGREYSDFIVESALFKRATGYDYWEITMERGGNEDPQVVRHKKDASANKDVSLTDAEWEFCLKYFSNKCAYCGSDEKMTKEHFIPFTKFGAYSADNIIPVCSHCNSSRSNKDLDDWYPKQTFYSKERLNMIEQYIALQKNIKEMIEKNEEKRLMDEDGMITTKKVKKHVPADATSMIFWLKNRKPDRWDDKKRIDANVNQTTTIILDDSDDLDD